MTHFLELLIMINEISLYFHISFENICETLGNGLFGKLERDVDDIHTIMTAPVRYHRSEIRAVVDHRRNATIRKELGVKYLWLTAPKGTTPVN